MEDISKNIIETLGVVKKNIEKQTDSFTKTIITYIDNAFSNYDSERKYFSIVNGPQLPIFTMYYSGKEVRFQSVEVIESHNKKIILLANLYGPDLFPIESLTLDNQLRFLRYFIQNIEPRLK